MIYRSMQIKEEPQFTFIERMFVSNKLTHRFVGHSILLAKDAGVILLAVSAIGAFVGAVYLLLWLLGIAFKYIYYYLVNHQYTTGEAIEIMLLGFGGICFVGLMIRLVVDSIKFNRNKMKLTIERKLNKHYEDNDGSEAT